MCIQELATALQYRTPIKIVNLNNGYMGMVRQWQEFTYESRYSHSYLETIPDFVKLAEAYGHVGMRSKIRRMCVRLGGSLQAERPHGILEFHDRSDRERLSYDRGRQGPP